MNLKKSFLLTPFLIFLFLLNCKNEEKTDSTSSDEVAIEESSTENEIKVYSNNEVFWGNTHLHTSYSGDAIGAVLD